jgi:transcriptional regulator with XRE-family HTH domain
MEVSESASIDRRIAQRLRSLRAGRGWSLDELAGRSKVSRATLSRLENAEVSATASVLGKLCAAYDLTMSRLMYELWSKVVDGLGGEGRRILVMSSHPFAEGSDTPWIRITSSAFAAQTIERKIR